MTRFEAVAIGRVESPLTPSSPAPRQPDEGAPAAWLVFDDEVGVGLSHVGAGSRMVLVTWLHHSRRDVLTVVPRGDPSRSSEGVFSTRSQHRPNPIGLHDVEIIAVDGLRLQVRHLEVYDGTPILDLKPFLVGNVADR